MTCVAGLDRGCRQPAAATERDMSSRSSLENIEALMNRYRKDEPIPGTIQRSGQDARHHAVSILRAAGMDVNEGHVPAEGASTRVPQLR